MGKRREQPAYEGKSTQEWNRLDSSPYTRIEHLITTQCLERYLPPQGFILDAGSGPGRYAVELAKQGYSVAMLDLEREMLALWNEKVAETGLPKQIRPMVQGDISALPYASATFDAVISLGAPLSHICDSHLRVQAVAEMARVLKPGGCLFATGLARISIYRAMAFWMNQDLIQQCQVGDLQKRGIFDGWIRGYAFQPRELRGLLSEAGLQIVDEAGCEGIAAHLPVEHLEQIEADPKLWRFWKELLLETCNEPSIIGISNHILVVGKKQPE